MFIKSENLIKMWVDLKTAYFIKDESSYTELILDKLFSL